MSGAGDRSPRRIRRAVAGAVLVAIATVVPASAQDGASGRPGDGPRLCVDAQGREREGDLDILILLDDTGSMRTQDPEGRRYEAIAQLVDGLANDAGIDRPRNIALVSFGTTTRVLVPFGPIDRPAVVILPDTARERAPGGQATTDYVDGVAAAVALLADRPAANCRVLLWFTDGTHDLSPSSDPDPTVDRAQADDLRAEFCGPQGLDARIRAEGINTFALLLEPPPGKPQRLEASRDVMQVVTGDPRPGFGGAADVARRPGGGCAGSLGEQIGRVLPVADADLLLGLFADLQNEVEGGRPAVPERCPYPVGRITSFELPDAHLLEWIALTDYAFGDGRESPGLDLLELRVGDETRDAEELLEIETSTGAVTRFAVRPEARAVLPAGWTLVLPEAEQLCLRVRPVALTARISTGAVPVRVLRPEGVPAELVTLDRLTLLDRPGGEELELDEALRAPGVVGRLRVDAGRIFSEDATLPVRIVIDGAPVVDPGCGALQIPAPGTLDADAVGRRGRPEAPDVALRSSACELRPGTQAGGGAIDWAATLAALNDPAGVCPIGDWAAWVDGAEVDGDTVELPQGGGPVVVELRSSTAPPNVELAGGGGEVPPVRLAWQGNAVDIPVGVSVDWLRRSDSGIATLFAAALTLVVAILSLVLLRRLNDLWMRPPDPDRLWGVRMDADLVIGPDGRAALRFDGSPDPRIDQDRITTVDGDGRSRLVVGPTVLARRLPGLLRPLAVPVLEVAVDDDVAVVAHPAGSTGVGTLPIAFSAAAVLLARAGVPAAPDASVPVRITVLVRKSSVTSPSDAVRDLLAVHGTRLAELLQDRLGAAGAAARPAPVAAGPRTGPAAGGPQAPPLGPPQGPPPGPPSGRPSGPPPRP